MEILPSKADPHPTPATAGTKVREGVAAAGLRRTEAAALAMAVGTKATSPGGTLGGGSGYDYGGREGERPGLGGTLGGGQPNPTSPSWDGPSWNSSSDIDDFNEAGYGGDPYAGIGPISPIVLDLDGDGIEFVPLSESSTYFDYNGDGAVGHTAWVGSDDGLLVYDEDRSETVNRASEFVFSLWLHGAVRDMWAVRAAFDTNKDGVLSSADTIFDRLRIWVDADTDAVSDPGELKTSDQLGLSSIPLKYDGAGKAYSDDRGDRDYIVGDASGQNDDPSALVEPDPDGDVPDLLLDDEELPPMAPPRAVRGTARSEILSSTSGDDVFMIQGRVGQNILSNFKAGKGRGDIIEFKRSVFGDGAAAMKADSQKGTDIMITAEDHGTLTLKKTALASLSTDDFRFVA